MLDRNTARSITLARGFVGTTSETRTFDALGRMVTNADNDYERGVLLRGDRAAVLRLRGDRRATWRHRRSPKTVTQDLRRGREQGHGDLPVRAWHWAPPGHDIDLLAGIATARTRSSSTRTRAARPKGRRSGTARPTREQLHGLPGEVASIHHQTSGRHDRPARLRLQQDPRPRSTSGSASRDQRRRIRLRQAPPAHERLDGLVQPSNPSASRYAEEDRLQLRRRREPNVGRDHALGQSPGSTSYTTNNLNQYTSVGGTTHVCDANGNLTRQRDAARSSTTTRTCPIVGEAEVGQRCRDRDATATTPSVAVSRRTR